MSSSRSEDLVPPVDYRAVFDALPNPCALLSTDLKVLDVNAAYPAVVGAARRELLGRDLTQMLPLGELESLAGAAGPLCQLRVETARQPSPSWSRNSQECGSRGCAGALVARPPL